MSVIATYYQGFHRASPIQHPAQKQPQSATMPRQLVQWEHKTPLCTSLAHNDLTQVCIVANCDTLHTLSAGLCSSSRCEDEETDSKL